MPSTRHIQCPAGWITLADAAQLVGVDITSLLRAIQRTRAGRDRRGRPPLPGRQLDCGWGTRNPWIVRRDDAERYAAAVAEHGRPGRPPSQAAD